MVVSPSLRRVAVVAVVLMVGTLGLLLAAPPESKKYALLVGVNKYQHDNLKPLRFAENDATDLAALFEKAGYEVILLSGAARDETRKPTRANIDTNLRDILRKCKKGDAVVVGLAGHGVQFDGQPDCFFCPSDARPFADETDSLVSLGKIYTEMAKSFAGVKVLLVDACRNDPMLEKQASGKRGGVDADNAPRPPRGVAALFSCSAGEFAFETEKLGSGHGVFFHYVMKGLRGQAKDSDGEVTFAALAGFVQKNVARRVPGLIGGGAKQSPNLKADLSGESPVLLKITSVAVDDKGGFANSIGMRLARIPAGKFVMGSPEDEAFRLDEEKPHDVTISRSFFMGAYEVTQADYERVMKTNPSKFARGPDAGRHPVESVSWDEAVAFCEKLSELPEERAAGRKYRLPREAEWEYACRAGTTTAFHFGKGLSSPEANFNGQFPYGDAPRGDWLRQTRLVGSFAANKFGLHDMHGNVAEWCQDWYQQDYYRESPEADPRGPEKGTLRVVRGGGHSSRGHACRSASRFRREPDTGADSIGFRVVLEAP